jgi:DNA-binding response OmpR family regulator
VEAISGIRTSESKENLKKRGCHNKFILGAYNSVMRVLVAEDKHRMARFLQRALQSEGYSVELAFDGEQALSMGLSGGLDLMVLDVMLPGRDGFDVIRNLRAAKQMLPTIMVTARDAMSDIVRGLDLGADDYLTKPFALDVLLARVRALTRRSPVAYPADLQFADLILNSRTHELQRGQRTASLTRTEYALLETLMRRAECIVPRDVLVEAGWGGGAEVSDGTLYVFIRSLRAKIALLGEHPCLHTARGVGYTLRTDAP